MVIPSYNSAAYLPDAIDSALNQTVAPLEVIVVNDGSTDETPQILERYRGRIVAITQENRGLSGRATAELRQPAVSWSPSSTPMTSGSPRNSRSRWHAWRNTRGLVWSTRLRHWWNPETGERSIRSNGNPHQVAGACYKEFFAL